MFIDKTEYTYRWSEWKLALAEYEFIPRLIVKGPQWIVYGFFYGEVHTCYMWPGEVPAGVIAGGYTQAQNDSDRTELEALFQLPIINPGILTLKVF